MPPALAARHYQKAAVSGDVQAQYALGLLYYDGKGVNRDLLVAVKWFTAAANNGNTSAQYNLGAMYQDGEGISKDVIQAYAWYSIAAFQSARADSAAQSLGEKLTADELSKAKALITQHAKPTGKGTGQ